MDTSLQEMYGHLLPALSATSHSGATGKQKQPREETAPAQQPSKRQRPARRGPRQGSRALADGQVNNIVSMLAALRLQQEDAYSIVP